MRSARLAALVLTLALPLSACAPGGSADISEVVAVAEPGDPPTTSVSAPDRGASAYPAGCDAALAGRGQRGPAGPRAAVKEVLGDPEHPLHHLNLRLVHSRDDDTRAEFFGLEPDPASTFRVLFVVAEIAQTWAVVRQRICSARARPPDAPWTPPGGVGSAGPTAGRPR